MTNKDDRRQAPPESRSAGRHWGRRAGLVLVAVVLLLFLVGLALSPDKGDMSGTGQASEMMSVSGDDIELLLDASGWRNGGRELQREIMPELLNMIDRAHDSIVLDMFLVNQYGELPGGGPGRTDVTHELIQALVAKKREMPDIFILFITDPINSMYASTCPPAFKPLVAAGGSVVMTDLDQAPDSNLIYSPFYQTLRPLVTRIPGMHERILKNPFAGDEDGGEKVSVAQYARLLNFKANHRKTLLIQDASGHWEALITSANPHTASGYHGNVGLRLRGGPIPEMLRSEYLVARASILSRPDYCFGGMTAPELTRELERRLQHLIPPPAVSPESDGGNVRIQYLSEAKIGRKVDWMLSGAEEGDYVSMLMFYLSDPGVVAGIKAALRRGAKVRLLLDPNKDAFGFKKSGVPNRLTARKLLRDAEANTLDLQLRWFDTHGEQAHFKLLRIHNPQTGKEQLLTGSANFTRRNLRGYNLETAVYLEQAHDIGRDMEDFFDMAWANPGDIKYSVEADTYRLRGSRYIFARIKTFFGSRLGAGTY